MLPTHRHRAILQSERKPGLAGTLQRVCKAIARPVQERREVKKGGDR